MVGGAGRDAGAQGQVGNERFLFAGLSQQREGEA